MLYARLVFQVSRRERPVLRHLSNLAGPILKAQVEQHFAALKTLLCGCDGVLWISNGASLSPRNPGITVFVGRANSLQTEVGGSSHVSLELDGRSDRVPDEATNVIIRVLGESFRARQSGLWCRVPRLQMSDLLDSVYRYTGIEVLPR